MQDVLGCERSSSHLRSESCEEFFEVQTPKKTGSTLLASGVPSASQDPFTVVNALHQALVGTKLHADLGLPLIAVVGSQSVGKSSVLQSLVGRDFLPRGSGIVTRRPLVLQLRTVGQGPGGTGQQPPAAPSAGAEAASEWAEFEHRPGERISCFDEVRREIELETERVCGDNRGVSDEPILVRIFSPCVVDLTLVDLPGLTRVPTGDQPVDISERIRALVLRYVSQDNCLILAVSAANVDLATSDALALAREVDPQGLRTLGVLTKLDLAGESESAIRALQGNVYPLRLGYVGVICGAAGGPRAPTSFQEVLLAEEAFLNRSDSFRSVAPQCGIPFLARRLHELLLEHIRLSLPGLRTGIQALVDSCRRELASLGDPVVERRLGQGPFLLQLLSGYVRNFAEALDGRLAYSPDDAPPDKLIGGARLHFIFHQMFLKAILEFNAFSGLSDMDIRVAMRNAAGPKPQLFVPEVAFETLVKRQIGKLEDPALHCAQLVFEELKQLASQSEVPEMHRFPGLREKVLEVAHAVIRRCVQPTNRMLRNLIKIELAHISVDHPAFIGGHGAMNKEDTPFAEPQPAPQQQQQPAAVIRARTDEGLAPPPAATPPGAAVVPSASLGHELPGGHAAEGRRRSRWGDYLPTGRDAQLRLPSVPAVVAPTGEPSEKERRDTDLLKLLISSYLEIVKKKLVDSVPKAVMHFMVNAVKDSLHHECITELYKGQLISSLLHEADDVRQRRESCQGFLRDLRRTQEILSQIRDTAIRAPAAPAI